jgi:FolB domain-containing protein
MDQIVIKNLRLRCQLGFSDHELGKKQNVVITMTIYTDLRQAGESDDPNDILNYRTVNKAVIEHVEASAYKTVEALATSIAQLAVVNHQVPHIRVEVHKPGALRYADDVIVIIERKSEDFL